MMTASLVVHIVRNATDIENEQNFAVYLEESKSIEILRKMVSMRTIEKAMIFAVAKGSRMDPFKMNVSNHLVLTKNGAYWDLM